MTTWPVLLRITWFFGWAMLASLKGILHVWLRLRQENDAMTAEQHARESIRIARTTSDLAALLRCGRKQCFSLRGVHSG